MVDLDSLDDAVRNDLPQVGNDLLAKDEEGDFNRGQSYKAHIHYIFIGFMYIIAFVFVIMLLIRAYDFVAPDNWRWLSEREDHDLERIVFSGIILSFASKYLKKYKIVE